VAIYCRISDDREGAGLGVARQELDCRQRAAVLGWTVAGVYVDNDLSAYSSKNRPEYQRLLADLRAGRADAIIAWHTDRLHRSPRELEEFIDVCEKHSVAVETVRAGPVDLSTPAGRAVARTLGAWARYESEHRAERSKRKALELAQAGKHSGGGTRAYGYEPDRLTIREDEAVVVREGARRVLAGEPIRAITRDLNSRGVPTATGKQWTATTLKRLLVSGRISGQREHQPRARSDDTDNTEALPVDRDTALRPLWWHLERCTAGRWTAAVHLPKGAGEQPVRGHPRPGRAGRRAGH